MGLVKFQKVIQKHKDKSLLCELCGNETISYTEFEHDFTIACETCAHDHADKEEARLRASQILTGWDDESEPSN